MVIDLRTRRDPVLDSAKGILIVMVILGHLLARTNPSESLITKVLITGIYAFHMPAFIFLAGITSKPKGVLKRCTQMLTWLAVFQVAFFAVRRLMGSDASFPWLAPYWLLWFLLSMAVWTALTPLIAKVPRTSLVVSIAISLAAGTIDAVGYPLSLSRTLVFLPFFVLGFTHGKMVLVYVARLQLRGRAVVATAALGVLGFLLYWGPRHSWFYGSKGYDNLDVSDLSGVGHRLVLGLCALALTAGLLALAPRLPNLLTRFGERSLSIYLLHGFAIMAVAPYISDMAKDNVYIAVGILFILASGIALLASMQPVHELIGRIGGLLVPLVGRIGSFGPKAAEVGSGPAEPDPRDVSQSAAGPDNKVAQISAKTRCRADEV